jgi:hypothetical protein
MTRLRSSLLLLAATLFLVGASLEALIPPSDFILCTCKLCEREPSTICQISPSGYSIVCSDWAQTHCPN